MTTIKGKSTGEIRDYDKKKFQARRIKYENEVWYGRFEADNNKDKNSNVIPTPEQITRKKKREEQEAKLAARTYEKRHRGGTYGTNAQKKKKRGPNLKLSYNCHNYAHKKCKGMVCECKCHLTIMHNVGV